MGEDKGGGGKRIFHPPLNPLPSREGKYRNSAALIFLLSYLREAAAYISNEPISERMSVSCLTRYSSMPSATFTAEAGSMKLAVPT